MWSAGIYFVLTMLVAIALAGFIVYLLMKRKLEEAESNLSRLEREHSQCATRRVQLENQLLQAQQVAEVESGHGNEEQTTAALDDCENRCKALVAELAELKAQQSDNSPAASPEASKEEEKAAALARVAERAKQIDFGRIGTANANERDDLQRIKGIGPFIETKLNALGIYTFRQIANFTADDEDKVNEAIEFFPGRIRRDEWSKQAQTFVNNA